MKITIAHPSRGRPERAAETVALWLEGAGKADVTYCLAFEDIERQEYTKAVYSNAVTADPRLYCLELSGKRLDPNNPPADDKVKEYLTAPTKGNAIIRKYPADWYVCVSDDTHPPRDWLANLLPFFEIHFRKPTVLGFHDEAERGLTCHPIVTHEFLEWQGGVVMREEYIHCHCDMDLFNTARLARYLRILPPHIKLTHHHPFIDGTPTDALYKLNYSRPFLDQGARVWARRRKELGII